jgi:hypothetical protein
MGVSINNLPVRALSLSDQFPFFSTPNGQDSRNSIAELLKLISENVANDSTVTQYFAPSASGWSVAVLAVPQGSSVWLLITPAAGYAAGTITLPDVALLVDRQEVLVSCTESVAALTVNGNGALVNGAPGSLSAADAFRLKFDKTHVAWYRAG